MKRTLFSIAIATALVGNVFATDLWNNQQTLPSSLPAVLNENFTDTSFLNDSTYLASDFVASSSWTINSVSVQVFNLSGLIPTGTQFSAVFSIWANTGALPSAANNPVNGTPVTVTFNAISGQTGYYTMDLTGLSQTVSAGEYWLSLTPTSAFSTYGSIDNVSWANSTAGSLHADALINPGGGFGIGTGWQDAGTGSGIGQAMYSGVDIQGTVNSVPEPSSFAAIAVGLLGLVTLKRRK